MLASRDEHIALTNLSPDGKRFIIARNDGGRVIEPMRYTMKNVVISSVSVGGGGGSKPVETLTLNYNQISWKFTTQQHGTDEAQTIDGKWDLTRHSSS